MGWMGRRDLRGKCKIENEKERDGMTKRWDDKKMDNPRGCCLRTPPRHLFHFSVTLFFCHFLSTDLAWSGATPNWEPAAFSRFDATDSSVRHWSGTFKGLPFVFRIFHFAFTARPRLSKWRKRA
jgi:hypothetical protein